MHPNKERLLRARRVGFIRAVVLTNFLSPFQGSEACCARSRGRALRFAPRLPFIWLPSAAPPAPRETLNRSINFRTPPDAPSIDSPVGKVDGQAIRPILGQPLFLPSN